MLEIIKKRVAKIAKNLKAETLDGIILTSCANVSYVTGFQGHDSWALILGKRVWLITDSRYTEQAKGECAGCKIISRKESLTDEIKNILERNPKTQTLGVEPTTPWATYMNMNKRLKLKLKLAKGITTPARSTKADDEIKLIKKAADISKKALSAALAQIKTGMKESDLAGLIEYEMRLRGCKPSFDTIVAFAANGSRPHHEPGSQKLKKHDTILVDYGCKYNGYCSDMTRCFAVGKINLEYARAYNTVLNAQAAAIKTVAPGVKASEIDDAARSIIKDSGFPMFGHGTGHGLGIEVHEAPSVSGKSVDILVPGTVITIEPGIYIPGKFGIRIEDDILVTEKGYKILTRTTKSPELVVLPT